MMVCPRVPDSVSPQFRSSFVVPTRPLLKVPQRDRPCKCGTGPVVGHQVTSVERGEV